MTLIHSSLTGKAREAYVDKDFSQSGDHDTVRQAVLKADEVVPEAYRQWFSRIQLGQTFLDFAQQQSSF